MPNSATTALDTRTPTSLVDEGQGLENISARNRGTSIILGKNLSNTEPKSKQPLADKTNYVARHKGHLVSKSLVNSAPDVYKSLPKSNLRTRESIRDNLQSSIGVKRPKITSANKIIAESDWSLKGVEKFLDEIKALLGLDEKILDGFETRLDLFRLLERRGLLSHKALSIFSKCAEIESLDLGPSYADRMNKVGLISKGPFTVANCTVPIYTGFTGLKVLDMTRVPVVDEDLRYIIRLERLQALGLSCTKISWKGLRYLSKHARFIGSLLCLKLCYMENLGDESFGHLKAFSSLSEIDLYGSDSITLRSLLDLFPANPISSKLRQVRLPDRLFATIRGNHLAYEGLMKKRNLLQDPDKAFDLSEDEIKHELKMHQKQYPSASFLAMDHAHLRKTLNDILLQRRKEEFLWAISQY